MNLLGLCIVITSLLLGINLALDAQEGLGTTPISAALLLSVGLLLVVMILAGPLKSHDAAQMAPKTSAPFSMLPLGGPPRHSDTEGLSLIRWHQRAAQASRQLAGKYYMRFVGDLGRARAGREWTRTHYRTSYVGRRDSVPGGQKHQQI